MRKTILKIRFAAFAFCAGLAAMTAGAVFFSCAVPFSDTETAEFSLPKWPPQDSCGALYPELLYWEVTMICGSDRRTATAQPGRRSVSFAMPRNAPGAVTARPVTRISGEETEPLPSQIFEPCGAVYPYRTDLTWLHGFSAAVLAQFYRRNEAAGTPASDAVSYAARFNWEGFLSAAEQKSAEAEAAASAQDGEPDTLFYNPWNLDDGQILEKISAKNFRVSYLAQKSCISVSAEEILPDAAAGLPDSGAAESCGDAGADAGTLGGGAGALLSSYVPQNASAGGTGFFSLRKERIHRFLYVTESGSQKFAVVSVAKNGDLSIAITPVPIYTESP